MGSVATPILDTPHNSHGGQCAPTKLQNRLGPVEGNANGQDGTLKSEYAVSGRSTPPSASGMREHVPSLEDSRKLRQAQQKLRKEQWLKKFGGVGSKPDDEMISLMNEEMNELISAGESVC